MPPTNPHTSKQCHLVNQVMAAMIQNHPFHAKLASSSTHSHSWSVDLVSHILKSIPRFFFQSPRSIGRQSGFRHRAPLKQRKLNVESRKFYDNVLVLGPAAYRDPERVNLGLDKGIEFFRWLEIYLNFTHDEITCKEMAILLARGGRLKDLWEFLKEMSRKDGEHLVTTASVTCLIKVLGEEGLVNEALSVFNQMKRIRCKPDVYAYNTVIYALCRVGNFKKARFLLEKMELPGFFCPPDTYTYTILISSYCKYGLQTGCRKAIRRRIYEANHLFRLMVFKGFIPDVVTYNCLIDGCCKTYRIDRALELFEDMNKKKCSPNRVTYNCFIRYYSAVNEIDKAADMMRSMQKMNHGVATSSCYTPIIHSLCEAGKVSEARDYLVELVNGGSIPREYTYKLVCDTLKLAGEENLLDGDMRRRVQDGIRNRSKEVTALKPIMGRKKLI